jgi:hypothetical protein
MIRRNFLLIGAALAAGRPDRACAQSAARVYWVRRNDPPRTGSREPTWFAVDRRTRAVRWLAHVAVAELRLTPLEEAYLRNDLSDGYFYVLGTIRPARVAGTPTIDARGNPVVEILHVHRLEAQVEGVATTRFPFTRGR